LTVRLKKKESSTSPSIAVSSGTAPPRGGKLILGGFFGLGGFAGLSLTTLVGS